MKISLPLQDLVFSQKSLTGSIVGGRADMQEMLNFAAGEGRVGSALATQR